MNSSSLRAFVSYKFVFFYNFLHIVEIFAKNKINKNDILFEDRLFGRCFIRRCNADDEGIGCPSAAGTCKI